MYLKALVVLVIALLYIKFQSSKGPEFDPAKHVQGQNILVTGASSGIGEQVAYAYAKLGANVYVTARREDRLKKVIQHCKEIGREGAKFGYTVADMEVHELGAPEVINGAVSLMGGLDQVILNHAVITKFERWHGTEEDMMKFEKATEVNYMSFVHLTALSLPYLKKSHGKISVISSMGGKLGMPYMSAYVGTKFALDGFYSSLRREFLNHGENVSITLSFLGFIETDQINNEFQEFYQNFNIDPAKMEQMIVKGSSEEAAMAILKATSLGERECYFPLLYGSQTPYKIITAIRNIWPELVEFDLSRYSK